MTKQEAGRLGGLTTAAKYGRAHMAQIGSKGFDAYCQAHHKGDRAAARRSLKLDGRPKGHLDTPAQWLEWAESRRTAA